MNESDVRELVAADPRTREIHAYLKRDGRDYRGMDVGFVENDPHILCLGFKFTVEHQRDTLWAQGSGENINDASGAVDEAVGQALERCRMLWGA